MAGFYYRKNIDGSAYNPSSLSVIVGNSSTLSIGELIRLNTSGFAVTAGATNGIAGVVLAVVDVNGKSVTPDSGTQDTWTVASDNQTVAQKKVLFIPALPQYLFFNDADGSLAQTNLFQYADIDAASKQVATSGLTDTATAQVRLIELDPDHDGDASKGLFQIVESQLAPISIGNAA